MQLSTRFPPEMKDLYFAAYFIKSKVSLIDDEIIHNLLNYFQIDIPNPEIFVHDIRRLMDKHDLKDDVQPGSFSST